MTDSLPPALRNVSMELVPAKGDAGDRRRIDVLLAVAGLLDETIAETADPARKERLLGRQDAVLRLPDETSLGQTLRLNRVHLAFNAAVAAFRDWIVTLLAGHMLLRGLDRADRETDPERRANLRRLVILNVLTAETPPPAPGAGWDPRLRGDPPPPEPSPAFPGREYVVATGRDCPTRRRKALTAVLEFHLRRFHPAMRLLSPEEKDRFVARYVDDCSPVLAADISEDKVVVDRGRLFEERVRAAFSPIFGMEALADFLTCCREFTEEHLFSMATDPAAARGNFSKYALDMASNRAGTGRPANWPRLRNICTRSVRSRGR